MFLVAGAALIWARLERPSNSVPDIAFATYNGDHYALSALRGRVVVLNFWASWCAPCRAEAAALQRVWTDFKDQPVTFIGVNQGEPLDRAQGYLSEFGISYPNAPDQGLVNAFGVQSLPTTLIIDQDGLVRHIAYTVVDAEDLRARIATLLRLPASNG